VSPIILLANPPLPGGGKACSTSEKQGPREGGEKKKNLKLFLLGEMYLGKKRWSSADEEEESIEAKKSPEREPGLHCGIGGMSKAELILDLVSGKGSVLVFFSWRSMGEGKGELGGGSRQEGSRVTSLSLFTGGRNF